MPLQKLLNKNAYVPTSRNGSFKSNRKRVQQARSQRMDRPKMPLAPHFALSITRL
jgi:hypothetical protein